MSKNGKILIGTGLGLTLGAGAGFAGYTLGRGEQDPRPDTVTEAVSEIATDARELCSAFVLEAAGKEFVVTPNDPSTRVDEEYDTTQRAKAKGQPFVDSAYEDCMDGEFMQPALDSIGEAPKFVPVTVTEGDR